MSSPITVCAECSAALELFCLSDSATDLEIKQAYRDLVKVWHPDRFEVDSRLRLKAEAQVKELNNAQDHLKLHWIGAGRSTPSPEHVNSWATGEDGETGWQNVEPTYQSFRPEEPEVDPFTELPTVFRFAKVLLRVVWRIFKCIVFLLLSLVLTAIALFGLITVLADYWKNEKRIHEHPFFQSSGKTLFIGVAEWTGLPLIAARGIVLVGSILLLAAICFGSITWEFAVEHGELSVTTLAVVMLLLLVWCFVHEREVEFAPSSTEERPGSASWILGALVLVCSIGSGLFLLTNELPTHSNRDATAQAPTFGPQTRYTPTLPMHRFAAREGELLWDFRNSDSPVPVSADIQQKLRNAVVPLSGHPAALTFQGPFAGHFSDPVNSQQLYTVILDWSNADRSHAEGDRAFAVALGDTVKVWELERGGAGIRGLSLGDNEPDVLVTAPTWYGQGQTQTVLRIFSLDGPQAKTIAETNVVFNGDCADTQTGTVADRVFVNVNSDGKLAFPSREHWFAKCEEGSPFQLIGSGSEDAEQMLMKVGTHPGVLLATEPNLENSIRDGESNSSSPSNDIQTVAAFISGWASAQESNDPQKIALSYASVLDRFFLKHQVTNTFVKNYMTEWLSEHSKRVVTFVPQDLVIENINPDEVSVRLVKHVITRDDLGTTERYTRSLLHLRAEDGIWKISSEQDFK